MTHRDLGPIEFYMVLMFAAGWGVLEWVASRMDRRRDADSPASTGDAGHAERK